jgi:nucleoside-diphosphate-sugar epimerase
VKVIVSGATGFLGGHVCRTLHEAGHEVVGLGRDAGKGAALPVPFEAVDLSVSDSLAGIDHADAFVHCAALSSAWGRMEDFVRANVDGTRHALAMADRLGVRRFDHISSPSVAFRIRDQIGQDEADPLPPPVNAYAASKGTAERLVRSAEQLNPVILRPRGIYGRGDTALLPRLIRVAERGAVPLIRQGAAVTDLTHVSDVVAAVVLALGCDATGTYNISGGEPLTIRHIISESAAAAGVPVRFTHVPYALAIGAARMAEWMAELSPSRPEPALTAYGIGVLSFSQTLDLSAARRDLGYAPRVRFADGLERTFS